LTVDPSQSANQLVKKSHLYHIMSQAHQRLFAGFSVVSWARNP